MSVIEIIVVVAFAAILIILIRRLPATRRVNSRAGIKNSPLTPPGKITKRPISFPARQPEQGKEVFVSGGKKTGSFLKNIGGRFGFVTRIWQRKKEKQQQEQEELKKQLKTPDNRSFWIENENQKQENATATIVAKSFFEQAEEAFNNQDFRKAESLYLEAARENPRNPKIFNRLGVIYLEQQNYADAIEAFKTVLKYDDKLGSRHFNLALAYLGQANYREAVKSLRKAVELTPENEKYQKILEEAEKKC